MPIRVFPIIMFVQGSHAFAMFALSPNVRYLEWRAILL